MKVKELKTKNGQEELFKALVTWQVANGYATDLADLICAADTKDFIAGYIDGVDTVTAITIASKLQQFYFDQITKGNEQLDMLFEQAKYECEINREGFVEALPMINCTDFVQPGSLNKKIFSKVSEINELSVILFPCAGHASDALYAVRHLGVKKDNCYFIEINPRLCKRLKWLGFKNVIHADASCASAYIVLYNIMKENGHMNVDLVLANPPYGKIGANITKEIIDNVDFKEYINLLPANDYKRNDSKDLFNYQSDMESIKDGFEDAAVTTHLAKIHKIKVNNMTLDEFERSQYIDRQLDKYFEENSKRKCLVFDLVEFSGATIKQFEAFDINKTVIFNTRALTNRHMCYSKNVATYRWNVLRDISKEQLADEKSAKRYGKFDGWYTVVGPTFATTEERNNFTAFIYSKDGFRFMSKIFTALNVDMSVNAGKFMPKVDWTRSWTVEEILADYGYSENEVAEVMEDLKNFKGMED